MPTFPTLIVDNNERRFTEEEREKIRKLCAMREIAGKRVRLFFEESDEGDEHADLVFADSGTSVMHICKCAQGWILGGESRNTCIFKSLDEIVNGIGILNEDAKTTPYIPAIHDSRSSEKH